MLSVVNYTYSRRLLLNSSLNINYRGYLLIDKNSSSSILDLPDFGELVPIYEVLLFCFVQTDTLVQLVAGDRLLI